MKTYNIQKHDGNLNKWLPTFKVIQQTKIESSIADNFNAGFASTGIRYVPVKAGDVCLAGGTFRVVTQGYLDKNPELKHISVGDLYPM